MVEMCAWRVRKWLEKKGKKKIKKFVYVLKNEREMDSTGELINDERNAV